jgi:hypothetical protein
MVMTGAPSFPLYDLIWCMCVKRFENFMSAFILKRQVYGHGVAGHPLQRVGRAAVHLDLDARAIVAGAPSLSCG